MDNMNFVENIKDRIIYDFTKKALEEYTDSEKMREAIAVADIVIQKFAAAGYITNNHQQKFVDITISACMLFNLFYNENDISTLFKHRVYLDDIRVDVGLEYQEAQYIYEIIESQLGENHLIPKLKPVPNSPSSTFCEAVWFVKEYRPGY